VDDPLLQLAAALSISFLLVDAGLHKLRAPRYYAVVVDDYRILPEGAGLWVALPLGLVEALAGIAVLLPSAHRAGLAAAAALFAIYFAAIAWNLARGRRAIDCGCGAPGAAQPLAPALLWRNALLTLVAALLAVAPLSTRAPGWLDWVIAPLAAAVLVLLYLAVNLLLANRPLLARLP